MEFKKKTDSERIQFERKIEQLTKEKDTVSVDKTKNEKAVKEI